MLSGSLLEKARCLFPHTSTGKTYLNHAAASPLSSRVVDALTEHMRERSCGAIDTYWTHDVAKYTECRNAVARMIHAESPGRIALLGNTSEAINIVAAGLPWRSGDRVLLNSAEFPANVYPYLNLQRQGVEVEFIPTPMGRITPDQIERAISPRTRIVALSAVQFLSGYRADLAAIGGLCRNRNVVFAVDGIQAVGAVRIDVQEMKIDGLAAGSQKWQMAPHGTGFLYLTEELQSRIQPHHLGWLSPEEPWEFFNYDQPLASTARRYEGGTRNIPGLYGMTAALSTLLEFGTQPIENRILDLTGLLVRQLQTIDDVELITPIARPDRAGIVTIRLPETINHKAVFDRIVTSGITIALREGHLRYSPHFYNTPGEIETAVAATKEAIKEFSTHNSREHNESRREDPDHR